MWESNIVSARSRHRCSVLYTYTYKTFLAFLTIINSLFYCPIVPGTHPNTYSHVFIVLPLTTYHLLCILFKISLKKPNRQEATFGDTWNCLHCLETRWIYLRQLAVHNSISQNLHFFTTFKKIATCRANAQYHDGHTTGHIESKLARIANGFFFVIGTRCVCFWSINIDSRSPNWDNL